MKNLPFDKKLHIAFGFLIGMIFMLVAKDYGASQNWYIGIGAGATAFFGIGKEVRDRITGKGTPERADMIYTVFAGWIGIFIYEIINIILK